MIYLIIVAFILFFKLIDHIDSKRAERSTEAVEQAQAEWYKWLDENMHPIAAREAKAYTDTYIAEYWQEKGMDYRPRELRQVTTAKERKARSKAYKSGKPYTHTLSDDECFEIALKMTAKQKQDLVNDVPHMSDDVAKRIVSGLDRWAKEQSI